MGFISLKPGRVTGGNFPLTLPAYFRVFFGAVAIFLASGILGAFRDDGRIVIVPLVLFVICMFAVLYREDWVFDNDTRTIRHRFGVLFSYKTSEYRYDEIDCLELSGFIKGRSSAGIGGNTRWFERGYVTLSICTLDGRRRSVEMVNARALESFSETARRLAEHSGLPLREEMRNPEG